MSNNESTEKLQTNTKTKHQYGSFLFGIVIGIVLVVAFAMWFIPSAMLETNECVYGIDETVSKLQDNIVAHGWKVSGVRDLKKSMSKDSVKLDYEVRLVSLCNSNYAKKVLDKDRYISAMMPCTISVWQGDDGKIYLTRINMKLMAKMFGGNISKIMGGVVAQQEHDIVKGLIKD